MNQTPTLLHLSGTQTIPASVFDDLQLRRLLSDKTISVLSHPTADAADIREMQELFSCFLNPGKGAELKELYLALKDYDRELRQWKASSAEAEKLFLLHTVLKSYRGVSGRIASLSGCGSRFASVSAWFQAQNPLYAELDEALARGQQLLDRISVCDIAFTDRKYMTKDTIPTTYLDTVGEAAEALGIHLTRGTGTRIRLNDGLSHALCELFAEEFAQLESLYAPYRDLPFAALSSYIGEFDFFYAVCDLAERAGAISVPLCYPAVSERRVCKMHNVYDISLLIKDAKEIIPNDTFFGEDTPFFFLTGANGGGKTTYLRAVGINLVLFLSGCPVFAEAAEIYPYHRILSHFPADERFTSDNGRLDEEKKRVGEMLKMTDADTFLVFNETFSGTNDQEGCEMTLDAAEQIRQKHASGLFVTHFHEVRSGGYPMLNTIVTEDESHRRTFRIVRDLGLTSSFANDILKKYRLDAASLAERSASHEV